MWYYIQAVRTNGFPPQMSAGLREQNMRGWRNWQTRTFEVRVVYPWGFEAAVVKFYRSKKHDYAKSIYNACKR